VQADGSTASTIASYDVQWQRQATAADFEAGVDVGSETVTAPRTQLTVSGLEHRIMGSTTMNGRYLFRVRARNADFNGVGAWNTTVVGMTKEVSTPGKVTGLQLEAGPLSITAEWSAPANTGGLPITGYDLMVESMSGGMTNTSTIAVGAVTMYTIENLMAGVEYTIGVVAKNDAGKGVMPTASDMKKEMPEAAEPMVPGQVMGVDASSPEAGKIMVEWMAPDDGGSPITGYMVSRMAQGSTESINASVGADMMMHTFMDVPAGMHSVTVTAMNAQGAGMKSDAMMVEVMGADPTPPDPTPPDPTPPDPTPPDPTPTPALPLFGVLALGGGLLAIGRRHLQQQRLLKK
jgi:hypothetical protein